jgi:hypothetical protein
VERRYDPAEAAVVIGKIAFVFPICADSARSTVMSIRDLLPWQGLTTKGDSQTTAQPSDQGLHVGHTNGWEPGISRRRFIHTAAAGATALAFGSGLSSRAHAQADHIGHDEPLPEPKPIPGGADLSGLGLKPPYDFIHEFLPGPKGVVLPFTKVPLEGLNVEPSTITDFKGTTALAYHAGKAKGSDGKTYNLETDFRVMKGRYVSVEGTRRQGTFAEIWIDLFELGSGSQVHDYNGGIPPSGLFWTVELPDGAFHMSRDGRRAVVAAKDVPVIDTFQFGGSFLVPATVSFLVKWEATGPSHKRGSGKAVGPKNPAAFRGTFARARSTGRFSGAELGFSFVSKPGANTERGYAEIGTERNGVFLS